MRNKTLYIFLLYITLYISLYEYTTQADAVTDALNDDKETLVLLKKVEEREKNDAK